MGRRYACVGEDTNTANTSPLEVRSATTIRPRVYDIVVSSDATPADNCAQYDFQRTTTVGSGGTAGTPQALDPGDPAALGSFRVADTTEPTYTASAVLLSIAINQRATFRWVAAPMGELVLPAAANGLGVRSVTVGGSAINVNVTVHYEE